MSKILFFGILLMAMVGCKENRETPTSKDLEEEEKLQDFGKNSEIIPGCYVYSQDSSFVEMKILDVGNRISGKLNYALFEKDANVGTFIGKISGDLLVADYIFLSEGNMSKREIVFRIENGQLVEGYGEVEVTQDKVVFKDRKHLDFSSGIVLKRTACEKEDGNPEQL